MGEKCVNIIVNNNIMKFFGHHKFPNLRRNTRDKILSKIEVLFQNNIWGSITNKILQLDQIKDSLEYNLQAANHEWDNTQGIASVTRSKTGLSINFRVEEMPLGANLKPTSVQNCKKPRKSDIITSLSIYS